MDAPTRSPQPVARRVFAYGARSLRSAPGKLIMLMALAVLSWQPAQAQTQDAASLRAQRDTLEPQLAASPFKRPLVLQSVNAPEEPHGDVYAVIAYPLRTVTTALQSAANWCEILLLQSNIKRCAPDGKAPAEQLHVAIGRKFDQPAEDAYQVNFTYKVASADANFLSVQMTADDGPVGTSNYRLGLQAVAVDSGHTFLHMSYSYAAGFAARVATNAYLATAGRSKVGFSVVGKDSAGQPLLVDGIRGVAERNTMRYFLAIESFLATMSLPADQQSDKRMRDWFAATERYPRQLHEMDLDQYLASKRSQP